jgi:Uma2 family endonuclease
MSARAIAHPVFYSLHDYVILERTSPPKHEYIVGQIYAMSGGTPEHARLAGVIIGTLNAALDRGRCDVYSSDLRIRVHRADVNTYPDASVVCGEPHTDPVDANAVTNPIVLVEVTSPSTEVYDRGEKFEYYKQIPSLREYVIVSHRDPVIEVWRRTGNRWTRHAARAGEQLELRSVDVTLDVDAIYQAAARARKSKSGAHRRLTSRNGGVRRRSR